MWFDVNRKSKFTRSRVPFALMQTERQSLLDYIFLVKWCRTNDKVYSIVYSYERWCKRKLKLYSITCFLSHCCKSKGRVYSIRGFPSKWCKPKDRLYSIMCSYANYLNWKSKFTRSHVHLRIGVSWKLSFTRVHVFLLSDVDQKAEFTRSYETDVSKVKVYAITCFPSHVCKLNDKVYSFACFLLCYVHTHKEITITCASRRKIKINTIIYIVVGPFQKCYVFSSTLVRYNSSIYHR